MYACGMCDGMCVSYVNQFHYMGVLHFICQLNKWTPQVKVIFLIEHGVRSKRNAHRLVSLTV